MEPLTDEERERIVERWHVVLRVLGYGSRVVSVTVRPESGLDGYAAVRVVFEPPLTDAEDQTYRRRVAHLMSLVGALPPVWPGSA